MSRVLTEALAGSVLRGVSTHSTHSTYAECSRPPMGGCQFCMGTPSFSRHPIRPRLHGVSCMLGCCWGVCVLTGGIECTIMRALGSGSDSPGGVFMLGFMSGRCPLRVWGSCRSCRLYRDAMCARVWTMHLTMISRDGRYLAQNMRHALASALRWCCCKQ